MDLKQEVEESKRTDIKDFYKDKEISMFLYHIIDINIQRILSDLNHYIECGDWKSCKILTNKLLTQKIFKYTKVENKKKLLDILIQKLLPNIYIYLESDVDEILELIYCNLRHLENYNIDWKFFYTLFHITNSFKSLTETKCKLFINLHHYYSKDAITFDEYKILTRVFFENILRVKFFESFCDFIYFFPKKYIIEDDELQLRLLYYMQNRKIHFLDCCTSFCKIIRGNGKLFFSKDEKLNNEYIETFIKFYFSNLNLLISGDPKVIRTDFESPIPLSNKLDKKRTKCDKSVVSILIELLFNPNFQQYYSHIESHFKIIVNNRHLYIKEKTKDTPSRNYIDFLQTILYVIKRFFHDKKYDKTIGKKILVPKKYEENKHIYDRLLIILKYLSLNLENLFLFDNEGSCFAQSTLFNFLASAKLEEGYMKQVLININFEAYIKMIYCFKDYSETRMAKYIMKLYTIMPLLLSEYVFKNYPKVRELIKDSIQFLADNVSSANSNIDIDILIIFSDEFFKIKELSKKNKMYEFLVPIIMNAVEKIMNDLLMILDLVCNKNYYDFRIFVLSMKKFMGKEAYKKISKLYANYIENNEVESVVLDYYFLIIDEEEQISIFNHMYNDLLYIDNTNNMEIHKNFIYPKIDKDLNIDISKCSVEVYSEKQLQRYQKIFLFFDYSKILTNDKMVKKFYELYFSLMNQKDKKFKKVANEFFGFVINSIIECKVNEKTALIEYPSEYHINIAIQMYEKIIMPYEKLILDYMKNNPRNIKESNNEEIDQEKNKKIYDKQQLEEFLETYVRLMHKVNIGKCNLILNLNFEQKNIDGYQLIQNQMKIYEKYKSYLKNSLNVITQMYEYNGGTTGNYLFSHHNTNLYFDEILAIKIKSNTIKIEARKSLYENINDKLFSNNLDYFKDIYMLNRVRLANIHHFEIIKLIMPKEECYYTYLKLYLQCFNSVNHPTSIISSSVDEIYSINPETFKNIFHEAYNKFISSLENLKNDSFTEQNIMKNIGSTVLELSSFYISLYPYDSLDILEKYMTMVAILKTKKFRKIDNFINMIISQIKNYLKIIRKVDNDKNKDKRYNFFLKKNEIIEKEINKIFDLLKENEKRNTYVMKYQKNIETFIDKSLNILYPTETDKDKKDIKYKNITQSEIILFFNVLIVYITKSIDKKSELYRKAIKFVINNLIIQKYPVSSRVLWIKRLFILISEEYKSYENQEWLIFKSDEEYFKFWEQIKYEVNAKNYIPYPSERVSKRTFVYDDYINNNANYNLNLEDLLISMAEIDEFEEDQKHIKQYKVKIFTLDEVVSKLVGNKFNEKNGLDFEKAKMFYYMFKLKYIDINLDYIKTINFTTELCNKAGKKIKHVCVTYEFLLGKYEYMLEMKLFGEKERNELWSIMDNFTRRIDKVQDEKIYAFFHYFFKNYSLRDLEFIFDYDFFKYPIDLVADIYYLFHQNLKYLIQETKFFKKDKTEELVKRIFATEENIILDQNYLVYVLKIYFITNGMMKTNFYKFKEEYTEDLCKYYMQILSQSDTKHRRYGLYIIYNFFFTFLNDDLTILQESLQKMALCINEFMRIDNSSNSDKGKKILMDLGDNFYRLSNTIIDFPRLCNIIADILKKENDSNDTNKLIYLQTINKIYKGQRHLNLFKYTNQEIFDSIFKVFVVIKNKELRKNFGGIFLSYFNDLSEEENKEFIEKYQKYIFEEIKPEEEDKNKYNYITILMYQLLRFKIKLPDYMQEFIIKLKVVNKKGNDRLKKIIVDALKLAMKYYQGSYIYMKQNISEECKNVLEEMTKEKSYFV